MTAAVWEFLTAPSALDQPSRTAVSARGVRIKMADERTHAPWNQPSIIAAEFSWPRLLAKDGDAELPRRLGGFTLLARLAEGKRGEVFAALRPANLDPFCAIKILPAWTTGRQDIIEPMRAEAPRLDYLDVVITKSKAAPIRWTGEEQLSMTPNGLINTVLRDQFSQAFRALANEIEADIAALYKQASRGYGSAGSGAFASCPLPKRFGSRACWRP